MEFEEERAKDEIEDESSKASEVEDPIDRVPSGDDVGEAHLFERVGAVIKTGLREDPSEHIVGRLERRRFAFPREKERTSIACAHLREHVEKTESEEREVKAGIETVPKGRDHKGGQLSKALLPERRMPRAEPYVDSVAEPTSPLHIPSTAHDGTVLSKAEELEIHHVHSIPTKTTLAVPSVVGKARHRTST